MITKITFSDHGQDFLTWDVNDSGVLLSCEPFQFSIWSKFKVINMAELKVGGFVEVKQGRTRLTIKYPITHLDILPF